MKKLLQRLLAPIAALAAFVSPTAAQARGTQSVRPALWALSDSDTTIYLFGTIHLLPQNYQWQTPQLGKAESTAQSLVIETIVDPAHPQPYLDAILKLGFARGLPPIASRVPEAKRAALLAAIAKSGAPVQRFDQMKTWMAAVQLLQLQFMEMDLHGQEAPETVLRQDFTSAGKPIEQLETNAEQFGYFDQLPETAQRQLLEGALEPVTGVKAEFDQMLSAWARGDVKAVAKSFNRDLGSSPELAEALITRRNANWSNWIKHRLTQPGAVMVAVGAGHLTGRDSVIELLRRDGYRVRRLQ
jgi:uncharacterized protein YbaP (TraB family)